MSALPNAGVALCVTATLFWWFYALADRGASNTVQVMPFMDDPHAYRAYWLSQAFGWSALLWAWAALFLGLLNAGRAPRWVMRHRGALETSHRRISLTVIALTLAHTLTPLFDPHDTTLAEVLVPGAYGHALGVWHTFLWGTNVWFTGWPRTLLWAAQIPLALLVLYRLLAPARPSERLPARRPSSRTRDGWTHIVRLAWRFVVVVVVLALIVATFKDSGGPRPPLDGLR